MVCCDRSQCLHGNAAVQTQLGALINRSREFLAGSEFTVKIRTGKYLVPDVTVQRRDHIQDPYGIDPIHLCVEILSPEDRFSETVAKCEEYHEWRVETTWIIDPESRRAWEFRRRERPVEVSATGVLTAGPISISLTECFSIL